MIKFYQTFFFPPLFFPSPSLWFLFVISHDLQKRVVDKEQEKQKISEDTKELTEKNAKLSEEMEKMNQELKNVEKWGICISSPSVNQCNFYHILYLFVLLILLFIYFSWLRKHLLSGRCIKCNKHGSNLFTHKKCLHKEAYVLEIYICNNCHNFRVGDHR